MPNLIEFIWIWNRFQNLSLPRHHMMMAHFLSQLKTSNTNKNGLLMAFRNSGKSTIVGVFCAWVLLMDPNVRILIVSADHALAKKMVRNIKKILEQHPMTYRLIPNKKDEWASDRFTVVRTQNLRDPSVLARGLAANMTGCRADIIICDDVEVPKTAGTSMKRADLRQKLSELDYILTPGGILLYIGTPHAADTIYKVSSDGFLNGFNCLKVPILNAQNESNWPDRFSVCDIELIKHRTGPHKFLSQMMLQPVALNESRFNSKLIRFYNDELVYSERNGISLLSIGEHRMRSVSCWWDPSFASSDKQDASVVACVFTDENGHYYVHDVMYIHVPPGVESGNYQCDAVAQFAMRYFVPSVHVETNGIGKFLPAVLRQSFNQKRYACAVIETISKTNKNMRILSAFDAPLANGALYMHTQIRQTPFIAEFEEWVPNARNKDDGLDAVAGCLLNEPVRLSRLPHTYVTKKEWRF